MVGNALSLGGWAVGCGEDYEQTKGIVIGKVGTWVRTVTCGCDHRRFQNKMK